MGAITTETLYLCAVLEHRMKAHGRFRGHLSMGIWNVSWKPFPEQEMFIVAKISTEPRLSLAIEKQNLHRSRDPPETGLTSRCAMLPTKEKCRLLRKKTWE